MPCHRLCSCHQMWCLGVSPSRVTAWPEATHASAETFSMQVAKEIDSFQVASGKPEHICPRPLVLILLYQILSSCYLHAKQCSFPMHLAYQDNHQKFSLISPHAHPHRAIDETLSQGKKTEKNKRGAENGEKLPKLYVCNVYDDWHLVYSRHYLICL